MDKDVGFDNGNTTFISPIKWCHYIVDASYITAALIILAHVIWYFAARSVLRTPPEIYLRYYIILPAIGLFAVTVLVDLLVRFSQFSLFVKEILSLSLYIVISLYLCLTHFATMVLLGSFILPILFPLFFPT